MASSEGDMASIATSTLTQLCSASGALSYEDVRRVAQLAEAAKEVLLASAHEFVKSAGGLPLLTSKSADGTPLRVVHRHRGKTPSGRALARTGKQGHEFLLKNQFLRGHLPQGCTSRVLIQDPTPLLHGKTARAIWTACAEHWRSLRQLGHSGCSIEHYCYDRCGLEAQERLWRQWHAAYASDQRASELDLTPQVMRLTEFIIVTPCAAHDAQSAFRWGMHGYLTDKQLLRDVYISIESLRNIMDLIVGHIAEWVTLTLDYAPRKPMDWVEDRRHLWHSLDVEHETVEVLAELLQLEYVGGRIHVTEDVVGMPGLVDTITTALLSAWKFVRFTDSRFLSVGVSSRTTIAALLLGVDGLVAMIKGDQTASKFYINGFERLMAQPDRRLFLAEAAFVSRVIDGVLGELMEDARVGKRHDELWALLCEEMKWLVDVPLRTWTLVSTVVGTTAEELRASCIAGGHTTFHFFWRRVLQPAGQLPWTLVRGDVAGNLEKLAQEPAPDEPVSRHIWQLMRQGFNRAQLVATVKLMSDINWSTMAVEQQHGTMALLHRYHPEYSVPTLLTRTLLMHVRRLLPTVSREEMQLATLHRQLQKTLARNPDKGGGRQALVSAFFAHMRSPTWQHSTRQVPLDMHMRVFEGHARIWQGKSVADRRVFDHLARLRASETREALQCEADRIRAERDLLLARVGAASSDTKPLIMSECALRACDLSALGAMISPGGGYEQGYVAALRQRAIATPLPLSDDRLAALSKHVVWKAKAPVMPEWARDILRSRDHFKDAVLLVRESVADISYWKVVYGVLQPYYLALSRLRIADDHVESSQGHTDVLAREPADKFAFHCNFADNHCATVLGELREAQIFVIPHVRHVGGMRMTTPCDPTPLRRWLASLPDCVAKERDHTKSHAADAAREELIHALPWASAIDDKEGFNGPVKRMVSASSADQIVVDGYDDATPLLEELEDAAWKALDMARAELGAESDASIHDFKTKVLGGRWTMAHKATAFDAVQGGASGALAEEFCATLGLQKTMRFDVAAHGHAQASILARGFCHRMQHYVNAYVAHPVAYGEAFSQDVHDSYEEPSEFRRLAEGDVPARTRDRIRAIRKLCV